MEVAGFAFHVYAARLLGHAVVVMDAGNAELVVQPPFISLGRYGLGFHFFPAAAVDDDGIGKVEGKPCGGNGLAQIFPNHEGKAENQDWSRAGGEGLQGFF